MWCVGVVWCGVVTIIIKIEISTLAAEVVLALLATVMRMGGREGGRERERAVNSAVKMIFPVRTAGQPQTRLARQQQSFSLYPVQSVSSSDHPPPLG